MNKNCIRNFLHVRESQVAFISTNTHTHSHTYIHIFVYMYCIRVCAVLEFLQCFVDTTVACTSSVNRRVTRGSEIENGGAGAFEDNNWRDVRLKWGGD